MGKKGFTLIEMVVVIAIVGVLTAIGVPSIMGYIDKGKASDCEINRKALVLKLEAERAQIPGAKMEEIIKNNPEIQCPAGGIYNAIDDNTVQCSHPKHGKDGAAQDEEATQGMEIANIVSTLTEEEYSSEEKQESTSKVPDNTMPDNMIPDDIEEPAGIAGDRCVSVETGKNKPTGVWVQSIADFAKEYYENNSGAENVPENAFPKNVLWIYQDENIYYFNPGNCISITYTSNENGGYSYQINMTGIIQVPSGFSVVTGDEIDEAVKKSPESIELKKGTIFLSHNRDPYICKEDTVIDQNSWNGEVNSGKISTVTSLRSCTPN